MNEGHITLFLQTIGLYLIGFTWKRVIWLARVRKTPISLRIHEVWSESAYSRSLIGVALCSHMQFSNFDESKNWKKWSLSSFYAAARWPKVSFHTSYPLWSTARLSAGATGINLEIISLLVLKHSLWSLIRTILTRGSLHMFSLSKKKVVSELSKPPFVAGPVLAYLGTLIAIFREKFKILLNLLAFV